MPAYVVKNEHTRKKVLHQSRLLLWLANFGEPMWMNCMCTSVTLLRSILEDPLPGSEDGDPVPGCVEYGLNLAKLRIIADTPESMTCQILSYRWRRKPTWNVWAASWKMFHVVEQAGTDRSFPVVSFQTQILGGNMHQENPSLLESYSPH